MTTWEEATLEAITRISLRHKSNLILRQEIIEEELANIVRDVSARGKTPEQTLSRTLQQLRDQGYLDFQGNGKYLLLQSKQPPKQFDLPQETSPPERAPTTIHRILRDTKIVQELKRLYRFRCQLCETRIELPSGFYCEAHHLRPLGGPHDGPDIKENIIIVCPNDHVRLDYGAIRLHENMLRLNKHYIDPAYIDYHNKVIFGACHSGI